LTAHELVPPAPTTLEQTGLAAEFVTQLVLKTLDARTELQATQVVEETGLELSVIEPILEALKLQHLCEIVASAGAALCFRYRITPRGRERADEYLSRSRYVGVAPVTLEQYRSYMEGFWVRTRVRRISPERVREALAHLVLLESVIDQLGAAMNSSRALFVYGPPGNGKTVTSQALGRLLDEDIWIPHAIEVRGSLIQVFDPINHHVRPLDDVSRGMDQVFRHDRRWVRCRRPAVTVGGELTLEALDLSPAGSGGFYRAPVQLVANGGLLVIDDFGRQRDGPAAFLNRWIAPLESRVDHLTLQSGQTAEVPFMVLPVFATNLRPAELLDEAFLRRIHFKVFLPNPTPDELAAIFSHCCAEQGIAYEPQLVDYLLEHIYLPRQIVMRCCQPRDLIDHALAMAQYLDEPRALTRRLLEFACAGYFIDEPGGERAIGGVAPPTGRTAIFQHA